MDIKLKENNFNDCLAAIAFIGKWHVNNNHECDVLAKLANESYDNVEKEFRSLNVNHPEIPHWHIGNSKGIVSKYHLLHLTSSIVTTSFLDRFFKLAKMVLSEEDPFVDINGFERMMAPIFNKGRNYLCGQQNSTPQVVCRHLDDYKPQKRHRQHATRQRHQGHAENSMVYAAPLAPCIRN